METFYIDMHQQQLYIHWMPSIIQPWDLLEAKTTTPITVTCTLKLNGHLCLIGNCDRQWYLYIFKAVAGLLPSYVNSLVSFNKSLYHTRSKDWLTLKVPSACTEFGKSSFSYCSPQTWNTLQNHLKRTTLISLGNFKSIMASYFTSYCSCF